MDKSKYDAACIWLKLGDNSVGKLIHVMAMQNRAMEFQLVPFVPLVSTSANGCL